MKNRKWLKILLVLLAIVIMGVVFSCQANPADTEQTSESGQTEEVLYDESEIPLETAGVNTTDSVEEAVTTETIEPASLQTLCVHVCGCVNKPGVYYLEAGARVHEAVEAAGGLTKKAADDRINLAAPVADGQQVYIPSVDDPEEQLDAASSDPDDLSDGKVNLNTATVEELATLPGIGTAKAKAIISYRENSGAFADIHDITNVSGIGEGSFEKIKDYIKV